MSKSGRTLMAVLISGTLLHSSGVSASQGVAFNSSKTWTTAVGKSGEKKIEGTAEEFAEEVFSGVEGCVSELSSEPLDYLFKDYPRLMDKLNDFIGEIEPLSYGLNDFTYDGISEESKENDTGEITGKFTYKNRGNSNSSLFLKIIFKDKYGGQVPKGMVFSSEAVVFHSDEIAEPFLLEKGTKDDGTKLWEITENTTVYFPYYGLNYSVEKEWSDCTLCSNGTSP